MHRAGPELRQHVGIAAQLAGGENLNFHAPTGVAPDGLDRLLGPDIHRVGQHQIVAVLVRELGRPRLPQDPDARERGPRPDDKLPATHLAHDSSLLRDDFAVPPTAPAALRSSRSPVPSGEIRRPSIPESSELAYITSPQKKTIGHSARVRPRRCHTVAMIGFTCTAGDLLASRVPSIPTPGTLRGPRSPSPLARPPRGQVPFHSPPAASRGSQPDPRSEGRWPATAASASRCGTSPVRGCRRSWPP